MTEEWRTWHPGTPPMLTGEEWRDEFERLTVLAENTDSAGDWEIVAIAETADDEEFE